MKRSISLFFLFIYMLSATHLTELTKLPMLIQHFIEHKQENKNLSFTDYLKLHYAYGTPKVSDYEKDMKLPFKTINTVCCSSISFCTPFPDFKNNITITFESSKAYIIEYSFSYFSSYLSSIWQPPKTY